MAKFISGNKIKKRDAIYSISLKQINTNYLTIKNVIEE